MWINIAVFAVPKMSLSNEKSLHRVREGKPKLWCTYGRSVHAPIVPVDSSTVQRCNVRGCPCRQVDGWLSVCDYCGVILHSCPWGCYYPVNSDSIEKVSSVLAMHKIRYHAGQVFQMEFPVFYPKPNISQ